MLNKIFYNYFANERGIILCVYGVGDANGRQKGEHRLNW